MKKNKHKKLNLNKKKYRYTSNKVNVENDDRLNEEKEKYVRLYAEFENYKKRIIKERLDILSSANIETINALIPVLDDIEIAKSKIEIDDSNRGIMLIMDKISNILKDKGLQEIDVKKGDVFDVDIHEAITNVPVEDKNLYGKIYDVISKGYRLNNKVIRHARVVIAQKK